jgi:hypothetical protein
MYIYLIDPAGVLSGPVELPEVPGIGAQVPANAIALDAPLAKPAAGLVWAAIDGQAPVQIEDGRGAYFRTDSGDLVNYIDLGPLPEGLTPAPRPDAFHTWDGQGWTLDAAAEAEHEAASERAWRDGEIARHEWLVSRHRAERDLQRETTLSAERFTTLLEYLQALRDWPAAEDFPGSEERPAAPTWLADLTP